jgi:ATP-dependent Lon protease
MLLFRDTPLPGSAPIDPVAQELPLLVTRDVVLFPDSRACISVGRHSSALALRAALDTQERRLLVAAQHDSGDDDPAPDAIHGVGCIARLYGVEKRRDFGMDVLLLGCSRARWAPLSGEGAPRVTAEPVTAEDAGWPLDEERLAHLRDRAIVMAEISWGLSERAATRAVDAMGSPGRWADVVIGSLNLPVEERQRWLEELDAGKRARFVLAPSPSALAGMGILLFDQRSRLRRLWDALLG